MLCFARPTSATLREFLNAQCGLPFTYPALGATATTPPPGYVVDRTRVALGVGGATFERARLALREWRHFELGWVTAWPGDTRIEAGAVVAVMARVLGVWCVNACRIVYVIEETDRFGFAYGTLPGHVETGEERFLVERDSTSGEVWYDILAFSRPRHPLARLGYPLARRLQRRFARDSAAAMRRAISSPLQSNA